MLPWSLGRTRLTFPRLTCDCLSPSLGFQHEQLPVPRLGLVAQSEGHCGGLTRSRAGGALQNKSVGCLETPKPQMSQCRTEGPRTAAHCTQQQHLDRLGLLFCP